jgi:hypothetical protein
MDISPVGCRGMAKRRRGVCALTVQEILDMHMAKKLA